MGNANSKSSVAAAAICLAVIVKQAPSNSLSLGWTNSAAVCRCASQPFYRNCPPTGSNIASKRRCRSQLSMVLSDNYSKPNGENDNPGRPTGQGKEQQTDDDMWEPADFNDADAFFNSMTETDEDDYTDSDNADDLMRVLQDMIDNNVVSGIDDEEYAEIDEETLLEILGMDIDDDEVDTTSEPVYKGTSPYEQSANLDNYNKPQLQTNERGMRDLERALMGGVVPADAGVGSGILPGDIGFDPLEFSTKDYFKQVQTFILNLLPERKKQMTEDSEAEDNLAGAALPTIGFVGEEERPPALILRDYREAEIRHGRLAMLAAVIWPLQEILDRIFLPESFGSMTVIYGGTTLPFLPLLMTFMMLNLGYLDIYSSEIKENESGDAFLPGECFWDPLCMMVGAPDRMKRNMQEREILNGRAAMIAVAAFIFEEAMTHKPIITLGGNELLFEPVYQVPVIQAWLDQQFGSVGETIMFQ